MNPYRTNDLWCKKCLWHRCRCVQVGFDPAVLGGDRTVVWSPQCVLAPIKRMTRAEFEQQYADDRQGVTFTAVPQYTRTMTMDDLVQPEAAHDVGLARQLRRNAIESVKCKTEGFTHDSGSAGDFEELKERD